MTPKSRNNVSPSSSTSATPAGRHTTPINTALFPISTPTTADPLASLSNAEDLEIKPGIAEMIREEERVSLRQIWIFRHYLFSRWYPRTHYVQ